MATLAWLRVEEMQSESLTLAEFSGARYAHFDGGALEARHPELVNDGIR